MEVEGLGWDADVLEEGHELHHEPDHVLMMWFCKLPLIRRASS
jgi:hypothetical protein